MQNDKSKVERRETPVSLKDRKEEILPLARHFISLAGKQLGVSEKFLSQDVEEYLLKYDWPGEEEELEFAIKRACILSEEPNLYIEDFDLKQRPAKSVGKFIETRLKGFMRKISRLEKFNLYEMVIPEVERSLIMMVLEETNGNQIRAAKLLGINRNTLRAKIRKLGIKTRQ